jgi:two-component system, NarL family, response regulator DegU
MHMRAPIRIAIADDHAMFCQGLKSLLTLQPDVTVVAEAERVDDIAPMLEHSPCDILLLDLQMDRKVISDIAGLAAHTKIIILTANEDSEEAVAALREGARGIVLKRFAVETLMDAVRSVANGDTWLTPRLQTRMATELRGATRIALTLRERDIVRLVAGGLRNGEVAKKLFISEETVKTHLNNIFRKLNLRDRVGLTLYAVRVGLIGVDERLPEG